MVLIGERAPGRVLGRRADHRQPPELDAVPPVHLDHLGDPPLPEPLAEPQRHEEPRLVLAGQAVHRRRVEVVIVIVGDHDRVDRREVGEGETRWDEAARPGEADRTRSVTPDGVSQNVDPVELDQERGVADPGGGRMRPVGADLGPVVREDRQRRSHRPPRGEASQNEVAHADAHPVAVALIEIPVTLAEMMSRLPLQPCRLHVQGSGRDQEERHEEKRRKTRETAHWVGPPACELGEVVRGTPLHALERSTRRSPTWPRHGDAAAERSQEGTAIAQSTS